MTIRARMLPPSVNRTSATKVDSRPPQDPDAAFRAGSLEATARAEERYGALLQRCEALDVERAKLMVRLRNMESLIETMKH